MGCKLRELISGFYHEHEGMTEWDDSGYTLNKVRRGMKCKICRIYIYTHYSQPKVLWHHTYVLQKVSPPAEMGMWQSYHSGFSYPGHVQTVEKCGDSANCWGNIILAGLCCGNLVIGWIPNKAGIKVERKQQEKSHKVKGQLESIMWGSVHGWGSQGTRSPSFCWA